MPIGSTEKLSTMKERGAMATEEVRTLPVGRHLAMDERGVGLRATWRLDRGFVNLSFWRDDLCVETFHLDPAAAASLIGFLVQGFAEATTTAASASLHPLPAVTARPSFRTKMTGGINALRLTASRALVALGDVARPK